MSCLMVTQYQCVFGIVTIWLSKSTRKLPNYSNTDRLATRCKQDWHFEQKIDLPKARILRRWLAKSRVF